MRLRRSSQELADIPSGGMPADRRAARRRRSWRSPRTAGRNPARRSPDSLKAVRRHSFGDQDPDMNRHLDLAPVNPRRVPSKETATMASSVPSDIEISHAAKPAAHHPDRPAGRHPARGAGAVRRRQGQGQAEHPGPPGQAAQRQVHRRDGHHPHAAGRGQDHHLGRPDAGPGAAGQEGLPVHPPAVDGPDVRHQGRGRRRRVQPGHPDGGVQPPPDRRHPRRLHRPQPARRGHRRADHARGRPVGQGPGQDRPQAAEHRPLQHHLAAGGGRQRPRAAQHRDRPGHRGGRPAAADRLRHLRGQRGHGHPGAGDRPEGHAPAPGADHHRHGPRRASPSRRRTWASPGPWPC